MKPLIRYLLPCAMVAGALLAAPRLAFAHCDTLDGPVVGAAAKALDRGTLNDVLIWVPAEAEAEVRAAFDRARAVRSMSAAARSLADRYFFETVVRLHRAGEGEPYTGLKPAGSDPGPAVTAADQALAANSPGPLLDLLARATEHGVSERFEAARRLRSFDARDVAAGRRYVSAYVEFVHHVERLHEAAAGAAHGSH